MARAGFLAERDPGDRRRQHIARLLYDCPPAMHRGLAKMSTDDPQFARNDDAVAPGLASYVRDTFAANAETQESPATP